jgi:F0F1-type ATP synthase assembly protein I
MAAPEGDRRPPLAVAAEMASQVITVALLMALPAWAGHWADLKFGTSPWLVIAGAIVGLFSGMMQLLRSVGRKRDGTTKGRGTGKT